MKSMKTAKHNQTMGWLMFISTAVMLLSTAVGRGASVSGSNTGNVTIPDAGGYVSSTIAISSAPAGSVVTSIDVNFKCTHTYSGDLTVDLNADSTGSLGNRNLWNREGGSADNPTRTTTGITTFNGLSVNRTWYLYAKDFVAGDSGYIDEWTITINYSTPNTTPTSGLANQYRTDSGAAIPLGGTIPSGVNVNFKATVNDADGDTVKLEVELRQLPATFTGVATHSSGFVSSGSQATTATASGLAAGNWGWRYRVVDSRGAAGNWSSVGNPDFVVQAANQTPTSGLANQYRTDSGAAIPLGGTIPSGVNVNFKATVNDADGDTVKLEVELRQLPATFTGVATHSSGLVSSGSQATTATASGLAAGNWGWRYRVVDSRGAAGSWSSVGNPDFVVQAANQTPTSGLANQYRTDSGAAIPLGGTIPSGVNVNFKATVNDADGDTVKLEVELRQLPATFTGVATHSSGFVSSGSQATTATASGLAAGNWGWRYRVVDSRGATGNWSSVGNPDFVVQAANQTPTSGLANQYRTDTGAAIPLGSAIPTGINVNFKATLNDADGDTVKLEVELRQLPATFTGAATHSSSFVTSGTQATTATATGLAAGNWGWRYRVVDDRGAAGNWSSVGNPDFIVQATVTPAITSVSPNPVTGSNSQQPFTINGNNFVSGCNVTLRDLSTGEVFPNRAISSFSANQIVVNPNFTTAAHNWSVEVINPGGATSGQFNFTVGAPVATPTITGVSPNPVTGSSSAQPFTILGNNFASGCNVTLRDLSAGQSFPNRAISSFSANQIIINPNFTTAAHNWSVEVINPNGASSGQYAFAVVAPGGGFYLSFPLANRTPYTATINSVFDHATGSGVVIAFTGEKGEEQYGRLSQSDPSFKQANGNNFSVTGNGHYSGGGFPNYLSYDGHQGFDYRTRDADQDPVNGRVNVMAAAPGVVHWIAGSQYNTIEIDHGGGYTTRYLHLYSRQAGLDGVTVTRGQVIGISGDTGSLGSPHLHFEVRLNGVAVDPYGWSGVGTDPYKTATGIESVNLWNEPQGCTYVVSPVSRSHGSAADSGTFSITAGTGCTWTATPNAVWITINSGSSGSGNGTVSYSVTANTGSGIRTGTINVQGTAFTISQAGVAGDRIYGVDVSSVGQGTITPSQWSQVKNSGKSFAWIRASKGNADSDGNCRFLDPKFYSNISNAKAAGLIAGAYHVGNVVQHSAVEEAAFFVSVAGDYIKPGHLRPVLDLESHSCGDPASLGASALSTWVDQWATEVQRLTGVSPIIYCNQSFLVNLQSSIAQKYDLWVAKFTENPESAVSVTPWSDWTAFQYSQSGSVGGISPVDLNVFRGTLAEFQNRLVIPMPQITGIGGGGIQPPSNGQFQFEVSAPSQQQVILQASDDLATWTDVGAVIIVNGKATFTDSDANAHPKRFYRPKP